MTEIAASPGVAESRARDNQKRIARRYASERRFRMLGLGAILLTGLFVLLLIADIVSKGFPAFFETRLNLRLVASAEALDPQASGDPAKIRAGDFDGIIRKGLGSLFPDVSSRGDRKLLNGLLSSGAADDFRNRVVADPSLIGQELDVPVLLSDDADQYFKGYQTALSRSKGEAGITIAPEGEGVAISADRPVFSAQLSDLKNFVSKRLEIDQREIARLDDAVAKLTVDITRAEAFVTSLAQSIDEAAKTAAVAERDRLVSSLESLNNVRATLAARIDEFSKRLAAPTSAEVLDATLPSLLLEAGDGVFKVTELSETGLKAVPLIASPATGATSGEWSITTLATPEGDRRSSDKEIVWLESLKAKGLVETGFAWRFLTSGDSREPELAGIRGALVGSILTLAITLLICLPLGVGAAIYLEEFAPKNRLTDIIEVNINNLAAVPSIVFGLLGLAMFLNFFGMPRSAPIVGGLVLALLVLPTIIIASRAALKAVPPSIKEAALGVGASHQQAIFHHVLPLAIPGIMTGTIIGMAHALGETAPLLMIGMVAFIVDVPSSVVEAATVMPVQVYLWSDLPEIAFQAKTAAAIIILLLVLFAMNAAAILVRKRFERRW